MHRSVNRREFLKGTAAATVGFWVANQYARGQAGTSTGDKLNIAVIGVANRGGDNIDELEKSKVANLVALCDVDGNFLASAAKRFPKAKTYSDWRRMLDQKDIDAVLVATPDFMHAWATLAALRSGRHVYCEKPLAHSIQEVRLVTETARRENKVTQMGTQIHAGANYRRVVELIQGGAIGAVNEVHVFIPKSWSQDRPAREGVPVPPHLHWSLWLGPIPPRPYSPDYLPAVWRRWWAFGEGTLGDMACHYVDLPKWALNLGAPTKVSAEGPPVHPEWCPQWLQVNYEFPARGEHPPVKLTWYDGGKRPQLLEDLKIDKKRWPDGILFMGERGQLITNYDRHRLLPEEKYKDFTPPPHTIPESAGHHKEWILACMKNDPTAPLCNFSYSGPLSEAVLLGTIAYRTGQELEWDSEQITVKNVAGAEQFIKLKYRQGWVL